jgi:predicted anti-sigma-YlaC factor YlaD
VRTSCEQARERLSLQLDGELPEFEVALLERHLDRCGACAAFAADVSESTALLRATQLEPAPPLWLPCRPAAMRLSARVAAVAAAAAAAALVAVSTVPLMGGTGQAPAGFGFWPTGLAINPHSDGNLGVQHTAFHVQRPAPDGSRRGIRTA